MFQQFQHLSAFSSDILHFRNGGKMKLRINHLTWTITGTDRSDQNLLGNDSEYTFGITYFDRTCAYIRTDLPEELIRRTVRHELTHMTLFSAGMIPESMDEEAICSFVESYGEEICADTDLVCSALLHSAQKSEESPKALPA
jgi:hypothetical protein